MSELIPVQYRRRGEERMNPEMSPGGSGTCNSEAPRGPTANQPPTRVDGKGRGEDVVRM